MKTCIIAQQTSGSMSCWTEEPPVPQRDFRSLLRIAPAPDRQPPGDLDSLRSSASVKMAEIGKPRSLRRDGYKGER